MDIANFRLTYSILLNFIKLHRTILIPAQKHQKIVVKSPKIQVHLLDINSDVRFIIILVKIPHYERSWLNFLHNTQGERRNYIFYQLVGNKKRINFVKTRSWTQSWLTWNSIDGTPTIIRNKWIGLKTW
jgi:hypothetical protein